ncbi:unnamed protein product [Rotaria socialis]|uniref:Ammonium transporter AmtB-like domain-containing protein n=1 Tax=Rotaria socialis TaxID=392032 RepID=A0A821HTQ3_9BILA|nr:unnamed protein product [Rotaria socialis]
MAIVTVQWFFFGFSFAFGPGNTGFGSFQFSVLNFHSTTGSVYGLLPDTVNSQTIPILAFAGYQASFAVITPALISGAVVGRMKLLPYMLFVVLWSTVCYDPICRWIFSPLGWLHIYGALDFAGGCVVHLSSGTSALVAALILGKRHDFDPKNSFDAHNLPFTVLGTGLLWVGWMGFNGGSSLASNGVAAIAMTNTNTAAAAAGLVWILIDAAQGTVSISGACSGIVVGLATVTPAAGYIQPGYALLMGCIGSVIVYGWLKLKTRYLHFDDTLDAFSCHGMSGIVGTFCTGLFCQIDINSAGANGAFYGNPVQLWKQIAAILVTASFSAAITAGILLPMHFTFGITHTSEDQIIGLDQTLHGESWFGPGHHANSSKNPANSNNAGNAGIPLAIVNTAAVPPPAQLKTQV